MKFTVKTDEQIAQEEADAKAAGVLPIGTYDFEITKAKEETSAKGNDMIVLDLSVFDSEGEPRSVRDWILPLMPKKFKHCLDACGLTDKYMSGEITADDFVGKTGKLELRQRDYTNKDGVEMKGNSVDDYVKRTPGQQVKEAAKSVIDEDSIPF